MIKGIETVLLFSSDAKKLAAFYRNDVGLKQTYEAEMGDANLFGFEWKGSASLSIMDHSEVRGKNKTPERFMVNFEVDDIEKELKRLRRAKVRIITGPYHIEEYGLVATLEDPDGNYFQFVQTRPVK
ncbi:hypothetical protein A2Z33_06485 [Candidatus Gottesmanbacteria bacterium RBG_16_52_11]|uniref:VOC domain-containing protein n=1 Tax=Candidatus Gottesmanbacteria bacterium RBG_16_52_11 TaxID=1798374 RepID=A0A1F5YY74_9BACT|nr:MAG: hypothetical protein A2Z33_06485 [Candidatus Gottesmanbacteria bacterium RBG_16_52_11]